MYMYNFNCKRAKNSKLKGFTLVELSIVLVIIGFLVGSVIAGTGLVESSRIISQARELNSYTTAFNSFVVKYSQIPGDMSDASSYWATASNGNGNGMLDGNCDGMTTETLTMFQHLSYGGFIPGTYDNNLANPVLGVSYPKLKINPGFGMIAGGIESAGGAYGSGANNQQNSSEVARQYTAVLHLDVCKTSQTKQQ